jgi:hypothetical protein
MRALCVVMMVAGLVGAADKPGADELRRQLAEAEAKVKELKAKLAADEPSVFRDVKYIAPGLMRVGDMGHLNNPNNRFVGPIDIHKVLKVLSDDTILLQPDEGDPQLPPVIVKGFPTAGIADGHLFNFDGRRVWKVVGTEKHGSSTLMVLRMEMKPPAKPVPAPKKRR